jgi:hypothetical protein
MASYMGYLPETYDLRFSCNGISTIGTNVQDIFLSRYMGNGLVCGLIVTRVCLFVFC